jgi:cytochrome c5
MGKYRRGRSTRSRARLVRQRGGTRSSRFRQHDPYARRREDAHADHDLRSTVWAAGHAHALLGCLAWAALEGAAAHAQDSARLFNEAQAMRGEAVYQQYCSTCHGPRLEGNPAAPLTGAVFRARWEDGQHTLDDLFYIVRSLMPNNAPWAPSMPGTSARETRSV